jgi:hypothetical protein
MSSPWPDPLPQACFGSNQAGPALREGPAGRPARGPGRRHQVAELPETAVCATKHRLARRRCPGCGAPLTQAELSLEISRGASGRVFREP